MTDAQQAEADGEAFEAIVNRLRSLFEEFKPANPDRTEQTAYLCMFTEALLTRAALHVATMTAVFGQAKGRGATVEEVATINRMIRKAKWALIENGGPGKDEVIKIIRGWLN